MAHQDDSAQVTEIQPGAYSKVKAARFLDVSPSTISRMIQRGELRAVHIGHRVVIPVAELERVLGKAS